MLPRSNHVLRAPEGDGGGAGGAPAPSPAPAPAGAPAPGPSPAPAPAGADSLLRPPAGTPAPPAPAPAPGQPPSPAPAPGAPAEFDWLPEKYQVKGADGKLDLAASSKKLSEGYAAAAKRIGTGDLPPETPDAYTFKVPDTLKDAPVSEVLQPFRERAHKAGLTQAQFEFVAGEYFELVPQMLDGAAKVSADQARAELQKVWTSPGDYEQNLSAAQRAVASVPEALQGQLHEKLGTDPVFLQFAAALGREMREDRPPGGGGGDGDRAATMEQLMAHPAYRDPKHAEHKQVSERARLLAEKLHGSAPAM